MIAKNNIFNVRYSKRNKWLGQIGSRRGFVEFDSVDNGIRCCLVLLCNYIRNGYDTIEKIIYRFCPPTDGNDTEKYIKIVCTRMSTPNLGVFIDRDKKIVVYDDLIRLMRAMAFVENNVILTYGDISHLVKGDLYSPISF